ncbi:hypothetical protein BH24ACT3_BH24ACT3_10820 [soil metagenome]
MSDADRADEPSAAPDGPSGWPELMARMAAVELTPRRAEMRRLAGAARRLIDRLVATSAPLEVLAEAADDLERAAERFDGHAQGHIYEGFAESANAGGEPHAFFDHSPMLGHANPLAPPIELEFDEGVVRGVVVFGSAYEGPPGCVHGGYVAAAFDEVLGSAQSLSGNPGMTGTLTIRYRSPTPLHTELRFEAGIDRIEGRKIFTWGRLHAGDGLCAEADGIFISIDRSRFTDLKAERDARTGQAPPAGA